MTVAGTCWAAAGGSLDPAGQPVDRDDTPAASRTRPTARSGPPRCPGSRPGAVPVWYPVEAIGRAIGANSGGLLPAPATWPSPTSPPPAAMTPTPGDGEGRVAAGTCAAAGRRARPSGWPCRSSWKRGWRCAAAWSRWPWRWRCGVAVAGRGGRRGSGAGRGRGGGRGRRGCRGRCGGAGAAVGLAVGGGGRGCRRGGRGGD